MSESTIYKRADFKFYQSKQASLKLIRCAKLSRAGRLLTGKGLALALEETVPKLEKKNPEKSEKFLLFPL